MSANKRVQDNSMLGSVRFDESNDSGSGGETDSGLSNEIPEISSLTSTWEPISETHNKFTDGFKFTPIEVAKS